jgi:hypothetical protein
MKPLENHWRGIGTIGQPAKKSPGRKFQINAADFSSTEQAEPVRVIYGTPKHVSGIIITPIFGFRSVKITTEVGK